MRKPRGMISPLLLPRPRKLELLPGRAPSGGDPDVRIDPTVAPSQGYRLETAPAGVRIVASDLAGAFYAKKTLAQIELQAEGGTIPCLAIEDHPDFRRRGAMLDVSRDKVPTMETLLAWVDRLSSWKINELQLYVEHTFAYAKHPEVWRDASPLCGEEIETLDAYCRERHVELVPNQNSFGHMERWLKHPRYAGLAEVPYTEAQREAGEDPGYRSLCPIEPRSIELVASLYDELLPHFTSRRLNVGCDETLDLGQGRSREAVEKLGAGRVYLDFLKRIHDECVKRGRTMLFWGDIVLQHAELIPEIPEGVVALNWGYEADHPFDAEGASFAAAGVPYQVCPGTSSWLSIGGRTENAIGNLRAAAEQGIRHGAGGYLITDWGDFGHWQPAPVSYLGFAYGAALSWCRESNHDLDLPAALDLHSFGKPGLGKTAHDLGNVYRECGVLLKNASALAILLLFPDRSLDEGRLSGLTVDGLENSAAAIVHAGDPDLDLAADLLLHACRFGIARLRASDRRVESIPRDERRSLAEDLARLLATYRERWLVGNRPGGLDDSVRRLERLLSRYSS